MKALKDRLQLLAIKLLGLKGFMWVAACVFLWFGKLGSTDWVILSAAVGGLNVWQKVAVPGEVK